MCSHIDVLHNTHDHSPTPSKHKASDTASPSSPHNKPHRNHPRQRKQAKTLTITNEFTLEKFTKTTDAFWILDGQNHTIGCIERNTNHNSTWEWSFTLELPDGRKIDSTKSYPTRDDALAAFREGYAKELENYIPSEDGDRRWTFDELRR